MKPTEDPIQQLALLGRQVRERRGGVSTTGLCRDICLATALSSVTLDTPVAVCYGSVQTSSMDTPRDHWWLRLGQTIVDPTIDQFGICEDVLIQNESDSFPARYVEQFFFCVQAERIRSLSVLGSRE